MSRPTASTVDGILTRSAARWPDRVALRFAGREWTFAELDAAVSRAAAALLELGAGKGDRVAAYGRNSDAYLLGFLGCSRAGLVHVPINYALTGEELSYLLEQSGSRALLFDPTARSCTSTPPASTRSTCTRPTPRCTACRPTTRPPCTCSCSRRW